MKVVFDKDGTLFNNEQRMHLLPTPEGAKKVEGWSAFNKACVNDTPIKPVIDLYHALGCMAYRMFIVTGAGEDSRYETEQLLKNWSLNLHAGLFMRPIDDHRKASDFKRDVFMDIGLEAGDIVVDDDPHIIEMVKQEFPGVIRIQVPSKCAAVQNNLSACDNIVGAKADIIIADDLDD